MEVCLIVHDDDLQEFIRLWVAYTTGHHQTSSLTIRARLHAGTRAASVAERFVERGLACDVAVGDPALTVVPIMPFDRRAVDTTQCCEHMFNSFFRWVQVGR